MTHTKHRNPDPRITQKRLNASNSIDKLSLTLNRLHLLNRGLSLHQLIILMTVSQYPGVTSKELGEQVELSAASISRNTNALSSLTRAAKAGLSLIEMRPDPAEPRRYNFYLTKRGLSVTREVVEVMEGPDRTAAGGASPKRR